MEIFLSLVLGLVALGSFVGIVMLLLWLQDVHDIPAGLVVALVCTWLGVSFLIYLSVFKSDDDKKCFKTVEVPCLAEAKE